MQDLSAELVACIPRLRRYARALTGDRCGADDLVQDTIERGWHRLSTWRRDGDLRAWLFGIMHNLYVDQLRATRMQTVQLDDDAAGPVQQAHQSDGLEIRDMQAALAMLPAEQREVLLLVALEEMTYDEVARTLSVPAGTVMSRLSRAREKLRCLMDGRAPASPLKAVK